VIKLRGFLSTQLYYNTVHAAFSVIRPSSSRKHISENYPTDNGSVFILINVKDDVSDVFSYVVVVAVFR
jgi:hypothetical protein